MKTTKLSEKFKIEHEGLFFTVEKFSDGIMTVEQGPSFNCLTPETIKAVGEMLIEASTISDAMFKC
jgi:hypothetical protein